MVLKQMNRLEKRKSAKVFHDALVTFTERWIIIMNNKNKKRIDANIKAINRDLMRISEGKLTSYELIKLQFDAIRSLIDDCEKLLTEIE